MNTLEQLRTGQLSGIRRLNLAADLTAVPPEVFELADSLEILDLSNNQLTALPDDLGRLKQLKILFCNNNCFEALPAVLSQCPQLAMVSFKANAIKTVAAEALVPTLRWLVLTDNQIEALPDQMGQLSRLQKLMLAGNRLRSLPASMAACHNLELIRLAANQLEALPSWLVDLPRLSWLAYAGNPLCHSVKQSLANTAAGKPAFVDIDWSELAIAEVLGQGASGVISKAIWTTPSGKPETVAVKIFKGAMTSDGLPAEEMQTCLAAGVHPNLVTVLGRVINHPEHKQGLVFKLIPSAYTSLGNPPSLDSCTRDTYPDNTAFSLATVIRVAHGIASVATHLHTRGILHGDLYAHNILVNDKGHPLLSDFGAASVYPASIRAAFKGTNASKMASDKSASDHWRNLEPIEVRAFGCLLEDLLDRCPEAADSSESACICLRQLQHDCMTSDSTQRPSFDEICAVLERI